MSEAKSIKRKIKIQYSKQKVINAKDKYDDWCKKYLMQGKTTMFEAKSIKCEGKVNVWWKNMKWERKV